MFSMGAAAKADFMVGDVVLDCNHMPVPELVQELPTTPRKLADHPSEVALLRYQ